MSDWKATEPDMTEPVDAAARAFWKFIHQEDRRDFDSLGAENQLRLREIVLPIVQAAFVPSLRAAGYVGPDSLPKHLPMAVDEDGNGPIPPWQAHHYRCWCLAPDCEWSRALEQADDAARAAESLRTAEFLEKLAGLADGPLAPHLSTQAKTTALTLRARADKLLSKYEPDESEKK